MYDTEQFFNASASERYQSSVSQDRKDKEKDKRSRGQSSIGAWKSEAEMVLRQQYD